ncbi:MAG TPA: IclR family transcriptional regulator [Thermodesulfobacteriota bacterium]
MIDALALLASSQGGLTGSDVSRRLGLPKSTVFLLLDHLRDRGVVVLDPETRRFSVGPALVGLAWRIIGVLDLVRMVRPHLEMLSLEIGEDVYLAVRHGTEFVYVDKVEGALSVRLNTRLGTPRPLHSTAPGKLFLAFGPEGLLDRVVAERGLFPVTTTTITDPVRLAEELAGIRERGYSFSDGENVEGIAALAAPVRDHTGQVAAALNVATLRARAIERRDLLAERLLAASRRVSEALGAPKAAPSEAR